jgi:hypothetical protein
MSMLFLSSLLLIRRLYHPHLVKVQLSSLSQRQPTKGVIARQELLSIWQHPGSDPAVHRKTARRGISSCATYCRPVHLEGLVKLSHLRCILEEREDKAYRWESSRR